MIKILNWLFSPTEKTIVEDHIDLYTKLIELESPSKKTRICDKCGEEKPLNSDNFQIVKYFRDGYSYYCNECSKPKSKD